MSSPDIKIFKALISIDKSSKTNIYTQLAQQIINAIQRGYLLIGTKLPGTRLLAEVLTLHRKTVTAAYNDLYAQGWIDIHPNKGAYIIEKGQKEYTRGNYRNLTSLAKYPTKTGFSIQESNILALDNDYQKEQLYFTDGTTDIRLAHIKTISSQYNVLMQRKSSLNKMLHYNEHGNIFFKEQLANYLNLSRGLHIQQDNILITRSTEMSLYLISRTLFKSDDIVVVAELSNYAVNMIFLQVGANVLTVKVDQEGICIESLITILRKHKIRAIYLTPHHHYPTTVTLSAQRRVEIIQLAEQYGFAIIEDDYDYEFNYTKSAILPLASADVNGMVIYTGTFGKSLAPAFKTGFVIAPKNFIREMNKYLNIIDRQGDVIMEQTLGEMINEGEIHRQLKKSLKIYSSRLYSTSHILQHNFDNLVQFTIPRGGLAYWITFNENLPLLKIVDSCKKNNLYIPRHLLFQNKNLTAMRIGFGHLSEVEMKTSMQILTHEINKA